MNRKQSAVERIRKKASATGASREKSSGDPYHNGETPSCRLLVEAVQDIFPELTTDRDHRVPSSELGQLLRWQVLKRRQERAFPPAPPLSIPEEVKPVSNSSETADGPGTPTMGAKKRRKKKKKKKEADCESSGAELAVTVSEESETGKGSLSGTIIEHDHGPGDALSLEDDDEEDQAMIVPLKEDGPSKAKTKFEPSLDALDRSLHDMEEQRSKYEDEATPDLLALPSDRTEIECGWDAKSHSSAMSFHEIPQESTDRDEEDPLEIAISPPLEPISTPTRPGRVRTRSRTLSASSFESFEGGVTPTRGGIEESNADHEFHQTHLVSPTHEWVPEENAEAKTETPPGDAIKNPLSLPYLLTLNTDNGVATTTINGKLIYAEKTNTNIEDYQLGSLAATKLLMEDWLGQVVVLRMKRGKDLGSPHIENDAREFLKHIQAFLKNGSDPRGIPLSQFVEAVEQIDCSACRAGVSKHIEGWSNRGEDKPLVLNPYILEESPSDESGGVDAAFDYVALEEGHHLPKSLPPAEEDGMNVDRNKHLSFVVRDCDVKNIGEKCLLLDRMNHNHLTTLVETWLPCGIEEEDLVNTSINDQMSLDGSNAATLPEILEPEEANRIQNRILNRIRMAQDKLHELQNEGRELEQDLSRLLSEGATQNVNILAFSKIKAVDDKCTAFKGRINVVVKNFSDGSECAGDHLKLCLWTAYLEALNTVLKACTQYYDKLAEIADQRGKLPNAFLSAPFRDLVQSLVNDKVTSWTAFANVICDLFSGAALQEYITRMIWQSERERNNLERTGTATVLSKMCNDLAIDISTWTETMAASNMGDIYQGRMAQTEQILERLQRIIEPLSEEYATVQRFFSTERNLYFASLRSNVLLAQGVKKRMRLIDNAEVEGMVTGVLLMWTHVRLMQNRMIYNVNVPSLPLQLKRFMWQDAGSMYSTSIVGTADARRIHSHQHCHLEVKSKRKALCILAGLAYRWLKEQCNLWRSRKAEEELLNGFEVDEPATKIPADNPRSAKSKKSKKKKAQKSLPTSDLENSMNPEGINDCTEASSIHLDGVFSMGDVTTGTDKESSLHDIEKVDVVERKAPVDPVTKDESSLEDGSVPDMSEEYSNPEVHGDIEPNSSSSQVFVDDGKDRITPEDFLIGRLRHIMLELGKSENIVFIS